MQSEYVQEYDLSRRHSLHLSYWTDGDTRRRGETLLRFKQMYRDSGMLTVLNGELPDYLRWCWSSVRWWIAVRAVLLCKRTVRPLSFFVCP